MAKEAGKMVSFDINYRDKIWSVDDCKREVNKLLAYVDLLKISEEELMFVGGEANIPTFMKENDIAVLVLTKGGEGATLFFDGKSENIPAIKTEVVDTTGAGDAYWGGFLSSLMEQNVSCVRELSMEKLLKAGKYGAISGSLCVKKHGGIPALPYREEIEREIG